MSELPRSYAPADWEAVIRARWDAADAFHADVDRTAAAGSPGPPPYCILIPPPNVTAALHLGHAFNNTLQDVLVRYHRMKGFRTLWMPGTDHAGIATQAVVEKRLMLEAKRRTDFTREEFIARVQAWKDEYEATIIEQLKQMGCSCDFTRTRFTMDEVCATAVREAFFRLFRDGLIYRGKRLVNWDPVTQTALADDEVEMEEVQGHMWYLRYPLVSEPSASGRGQAEGDYIVVATTRPETMLGDTAVAMNPRDPWAAKYVGRKVRLPLVDRIVPIIADDFVVMPVSRGGPPDDPKAAIATGFLKVTPVHDPNDYEIGQRHSEEIAKNSSGQVMINVLAPDATISDQHGWPQPPEGFSPDVQALLGLSREEARKRVVQWFKDHGLLEDVKPYTHSVGHSYRSHVPIEPYLSDQWYVKVTDDRMKGEALRAMGQFDGGTGVPPVSAPRGTGVPPVSPEMASKVISGARPRSSVTDHLVRTRRNLPHWSMGGSTYFVTFRSRTAHLTPEERRHVLDACLHWHGDRLHLHLAVVMPDHVHMLLSPARKEDGEWWPLSGLLHSIKSYTAHAIQKQRGAAGALWQDESFDRIVRNDDEFLETANYMLRNPVEAGLCASAEEYEFIAAPEVRIESGGRPRRGLRPADTGGTPVPRKHCGTPALPDPCDGELLFFPARYAKTFQSWHENLRDWCISRQLWWGHRIPVWAFEPQAFWEGDREAAILEFSRQVESWKNEGRLAEYQRQRQDLGPADQINRSETVRYFSIRQPSDTEIAGAFEAMGCQQDPDVLDTWFSSGLWPLSTMGWPDPGRFSEEIPEGESLLETFNPSTVLCTAREIITLWVSRMVMFNRYFREGKLPFRHVYIHAMIQDGHGQKMSKSLGNGVDPRDIIHSHGADAMRFTLAQLATSTQDVRMPVDMVCPAPGCGEVFHPKEITTSAGYRVAAPELECPKCRKKMASGYGAATGIAPPTKERPLARNSSSKFDLGRNFANKLWNATRFALANLNGGDGLPSERALRTAGTDVPPQTLPLVDRWIISRLHRTLHRAEAALAEYEFSAYADAMYDFVWRDFCDWYLEAIKPTIRSSPVQQQVLRTVLNAILRMLHPVMPFVTEALWTSVHQAGGVGLAGIDLPPGDLLATAAWPRVDSSLDDAAAMNEFERVQALTDAIRNVRGEHKVNPRKKIRLLATPEVIELIGTAGRTVQSLAGLEAVDPLPDGSPAARPPGAVIVLFEGREQVLLDVAEAIDLEAELDRLRRQIAGLEREESSLSGRLANTSYVSKAPQRLVDETRQKLEQVRLDLSAARAALESLAS
jgi:valyl-tRNA synthetase